MVASIININFNYSDEQIILNNTDLTLEKGNITLVEGSNGCGKTTLIKYLGGFFKEGQENVSLVSFLKNNKYKFYSFPEDLLFPEFTVKDYLFLCSENKKYFIFNKKRKFIDNVEKTLLDSEIVAKSSTLIKELSSGNRTLLKFLNLWLNKYSVLFLDEPTSHLDDNKVNLLLAIISNYTKENESYCILSSHDPRLFNSKALPLSKYRYVLTGGKCVRKF